MASLFEAKDCLDLSSHNIDDIQAESIFNSLQSNLTVHSVILGNNLIGDTCCQIVQ